MRIVPTIVRSGLLVSMALLTVHADAGAQGAVDRLKNAKKAAVKRPVWVRPTKSQGQLGKIAPLPGARRTIAIVPRNMARIVDLAKRFKGDKAAVKAEVLRAGYDERVKEICYADGVGNVTCTNVREFLMQFGEADAIAAMMMIDDAIDVMGVGTEPVMVACEGRDFGHISNVVGTTTRVTEGVVLGRNKGSGTPNIGKGGASIGRGKGGANAASKPAGPQAARGITQACRDAQRNSVRNGLNSPAPGDAQYQQAVDYAVSAMDAAVANCQEPGNSMIAQAPASGDDGSIKQKTDMSGAEAGQWIIETTAAIASVGQDAAEAGKSPLAFVAKVALATVGVSTGLMEGETAEDINQAASAIDLVVTAGTAGATTVAAAGPITVGAAVIGTAFFSYSAAEPLGKASANALDGFYQKVADGVWNLQHGGSSAPAGTGSKGGKADVQRPGGEDTRSKCEQLADRWEQMKANCSQAGNNWQTYDCMIFVAKMNGCADPALVNPGPQGDYVCTAKEGEPYNDCAQRQKIVDMVGLKNPDSSIDCEKISSIAASAGQFREMVQKELCKQATPNPDGSGPCVENKIQVDERSQKPGGSRPGLKRP